MSVNPKFNKHFKYKILKSFYRTYETPIGTNSSHSIFIP